MGFYQTVVPPSLSISFRDLMLYSFILAVTYHTTENVKVRGKNVLASIAA